MPDGTTPTTDPLKAGDEAAADLADALNTIGIVLPSLRGDWTLGGNALVQLGGAPPETARQLASWIRDRSRTHQNDVGHRDLQQGAQRQR
jgi:hypothetical protein